MSCAQPNRTARIVQSLGGSIVSGGYRSGEILPRELVLRGQFGVSRVILREAMRVLTAKGLLAARPRGGTSVLPQEDWNLLDPDVLLWLLQRSHSVPVFRDLTQMRLALEPEAAALAAVAGTPEQKRSIQCAAAAIAACGANEARLALDTSFHAGVLGATGNRIYAQFGKSVEPMLRFTYAMVGEPDSVQREGISDRGRVAEAIHAGNTDLARLAMRAVIEHQTRISHAPAAI
jgi:DNA-binding FadR family transcriptional regulator